MPQALEATSADLSVLSAVLDDGCKLICPPTPSTCPGSDHGSSVADSDDEDFPLLPDAESEFPQEENGLETHVASPKDVCKVQKCDRSCMESMLPCCVLALLVVVCGTTSQVPFEVMNSRDKGCAHLVVLVEHIFGIAASMHAITKPRRMPWRLHLCQAALDVGYAKFISTALSSSLPTSAVLVLKNGSLVVTVLLEACVLRCKHTSRQLFATLCVTGGIVLISASINGFANPAGAAAEKQFHVGSLVGFVTLVLALVCRAASGTLQEVSCRRYGATVSEQLLFRCALGVPLLLTQWPAILSHAAKWTLQPEVGGLPGVYLWMLASTTEPRWQLHGLLINQAPSQQLWC